MALQPAEPTSQVASGRPGSPEAAVARERLEAGRAEILARHRAGAGGQEVVRSISALTDDVVQQMFAAISSELGARGAPSTGRSPPASEPSAPGSGAPRSGAVAAGAGMG
ncbi:MAG TPA: hypothetical protein VG496_12470, partial [Myxococcales bacterium]|nr:hypothetical protein [Myxococcales bacterium]